MINDEIEELLGAYALHATEPDERDEIDAHLANCPRCREEVQAHYEMAAMIGTSAMEAPPGLWEKIAGSLADARPRVEHPAPSLPSNVVPMIAARPRVPWRNALVSSVAAVAAAVLIFLGVQVSQLHSQVRTLQHLKVASSLTEVAINPHRTVQLTSPTHAVVAEVIVAPDGQAYWVKSSLGDLPSSRTYQLWGLADGQVVSLGLVGPNPHNYDGFKLASDTTRVMVTTEPEGGTAKPTLPVVAQGAVPSSSLT
jgi:anti-sigma factor RsiW